MDTVLLQDGTVGTVDTINGQHASNFIIGERITVRLYDENGCPIEVTGRLAEVLEEGQL